jgi:3-methylcrotonyl-CoA carboxylase alpha subunit
MKFQIKIHENPYTVELNPLEGEGRFRALLGKKELEVTGRIIDDHRIRFLVDDQEVEAYLTGDKKSKEIFISGYSFTVSDGGSQRRRSSSKGVGDFTQNQVTPPMPSVVVRILVQEGDWVTVGQGLIVVSAMKMETTLKAPKAGRVVKINTSLQAKVMPGDILIEIEEGTQDGG